jgi:hypothetical protein
VFAGTITTRWARLLPARDDGLLNDGHYIGAFSDQGEIITMNPGDLWITLTSSKAVDKTARRPSFWAAERSASLPTIPPLRPQLGST